MNFFLFLLLSFSIDFCTAQDKGKTPQNLKTKISTAYQQFESDKQMSYGISSLTVLNANTGEIVFSKNENIGLATASTLKTITAATAYHLLGENFTWKTTLGYTGSISEDGTLNGDLVITGGGDPSLGSPRYEETKAEVILKKWQDAIARAGIRRITGYVISDDRIFGTQTMPGGWTWQDMGNYYGAGPSSLTWAENQFDLVFQAKAVGEPATLIRTDPVMNYLKIINEVTTGAAGTGDNVYAYSAPYSNVIYLRGTYGIDLKKVIGASVPDPAFDVAFRLEKRLSGSGIQSGKGATTYRILSTDAKKIQNAVKVIAVHTSPALGKIIYWFNQKSINLFGEHLVKTLALEKGKKPTTANGVQVVKEFWKEKIGIDPNAMNIYDGSGLSPANRVATLPMAQILQSMKREPFFNSFYESLPVYNKMKMKSGSISDVIGYTGYQTSSSGTPLVFSFIINNYSGSSSAVRQKMFAVLDALK